MTLADLFGVLATNPLNAVNSVARRTTGDLLFPLERLQKYRTDKSNDEKTQFILNLMRQSQPVEPGSPQDQINQRWPE